MLIIFILTKQLGFHKLTKPGAFSRLKTAFSFVCSFNIIIVFQGTTSQGLTVQELIKEGMQDAQLLFKPLV